jgi:hypothetical protein
MMRTVWKYELEVTDLQAHSIPEGGTVLCVQVQRGRPCVWVLVDSENPAKERIFRTFGTGHKIPENEKLDYIGSYQLYRGDFLGHLFEEV